MPTIAGCAASVSFAPFADACRAYRQVIDKAKRDAMRPTAKWERYAAGADPVDLGERTTNSGWQRMGQIYKLLNKFDRMEDYKRNKMQRRSHEIMIQASLRVILGADFRSNVGRLRRLYRLRQLRQECLIAAPRRCGKTYAATMFCAVLMLVVPLVTIACFSTGRRASRAFLVKVNKMVAALDRIHEMDTYNEEEMTIKNPTDKNDIRSCKSFPSRPEIGLSSRQSQAASAA